MQSDFKFEMSDTDSSLTNDRSPRTGGWQLSVGHLFWLTGASALVVALYQFAGLYWCLLLGVAVVCWRIPAYDGLNPIVQALTYAVVVLAITCGLAYKFNVEPLAAIMPCCMLPSLAYLVGFTKGMNQ